MGLNSSSTKKLGERPLEFPLNLGAPLDIHAVQVVPPRHMGILETSGRVIQMDYDRNVVGWVDAKGNAFRNDYNRTKVGRVDVSTRLIYQEDFAKTLVGRVDENGNIFACKTVVHQSLTDVVIGKVSGVEDGYVFAACAFLLLF